MKKVAVLVVVFVFTASLFCFPALAASSVLSVQNVNFDGASLTAIGTNGSIQSMVVSSNTSRSMLRFYPGSSTEVTFSASKSSFFVLRSGFKYRIRFSANIAGDNFYLTDIEVKLHDTPVLRNFTYSSDRVYAYFDFVTDVMVQDSTFSTLVFNFQTNKAVSPFNFWVQNFTVDVIDPNQEIVDGIGDKIDQSTDKFLNGNGTELAPDHNKDMDDKSNQLQDLENGALGGKTDEQIQQEVDNALSFDTGSLDGNASQKMSGLFDGLLVVFGVDYQSLLMLALSLGLAAFIIGRRYKA